ARGPSGASSRAGSTCGSVRTAGTGGFPRGRPAWGTAPGAGIGSGSSWRPGSRRGSASEGILPPTTSGSGRSSRSPRPRIRTGGEVNARLVDEPQLVNSDPYGDGWMIVIEPTDISAVEGLLDADAYRTFTEKESGESA